MRHKGTLVEWNDSRGFGFIEPAQGGERAFCHISQFLVRSKRPALGDRLTYELSRDERGRPRAMRIRSVEEGRVVAKRESSSRVSPWIAVVGAAGFLGVVVWLFLSGRIPVIVPAAYVALSLIAIAAYAIDKSAAMNQRWRTKESTLHFIALLGGWPGAWIAQLLFRHKRRCRSSYRSSSVSR